MLPENSESVQGYRVEDHTKDHFCRLTHQFLDLWQPILTAAEFSVFVSICRLANFRTGESDGWWTFARCHRMTSLNRKTILRAFKTLQKVGLVVAVGPNGKAAHLKIYQDITPNVDASTFHVKHRKLAYRPGPPKGHDRDHQRDTTGTTKGTQPVPASGPGSGELAVPVVGNWWSRFLESLEPVEGLPTPPTDDDESARRSLDLLIEGFAEFGLTLDVKSAVRMITSTRQVRPDVRIAELLLIARDRLPYIQRRGNIQSLIPYLTMSILNCLRGHTFTLFRERWEKIEAESKQRLEDERKIAAWKTAHPDVSYLTPGMIEQIVN